MYPPPAGKALTLEQARELDDTFLSSDPFEYFRSRIAPLLTWHDLATSSTGEPIEAVAGPARAEFNEYLQRAAAGDPLREIDVQAQVAADALALRHHAAEAVLRIAYARLTPDNRDDVRCVWAEIASGPIQIADVITRLNDDAGSPDSRERFFCAVVPPESRETARTDADVVDAANVFGEWLAYAMKLMQPGEINLQAAHNKVKHGLALRARADMRITFAKMPPSKDGTVRLSALTGEGTIDLFDQPALELLASGPKVDGHPQGLEVTQLRLKPSALLADAYMLAWTHGAIFHVSAVEHFADRDDLPDHLGPPGFPGYPVGGLRPTDIDSTAPLGMRFPITTPPGGLLFSAPVIASPWVGVVGWTDHTQGCDLSAQRPQLRSPSPPHRVRRGRHACAGRYGSRAIEAPRRAGSVPAR